MCRNHLIHELAFKVEMKGNGEKDKQAREELLAKVAGFLSCMDGMLKVPLCFFKVKILQQREEWMGRACALGRVHTGPVHRVGRPYTTLQRAPETKSETNSLIARHRGYYYHDYCFYKSWPLCGFSKEGSQTFLLHNLKAKEIINLVPVGK